MLRDTTPTLTPSHATCGLLGIVSITSECNITRLEAFQKSRQANVNQLNVTNVTDVDMFLKIKCNLSPISSQLMHQEISTSHHQL